MEEILASIRAIVSGGGEAAQTEEAPTDSADPGDQAAESAAFDEEDDQPTPQSELLELARIARSGASDELLAPETKDAASDTLSALGAVLVREYEGSERTLEGVVRELLRPMLKDWLDENLPDIVERMVSREIMRITGK